MNVNELLIKIKKYIAQIEIYVKMAGELLHKAICSENTVIKMIKDNKRKLFAITSVSILIFVALLHSFPPVPLVQIESELNPALIEPKFIAPESITPRDIILVKPEEPEVLPILDLSGLRADIESKMRQINEPTAWGEEVLYSAGLASSIDGPVLTRLFLYNTNTHEEKEVAVSNVRFGEIYEGRLSDSWIVWLDTNQSGTNNIYALNRSTGKSIRINSTSLNRPQIALWGDFLVWSGQKKEHKDEMHVFDLGTGSSFKVEDFDNPTFGTSSPAVHSNFLVWAYPHPDDPAGRSVIKTLDLTTLNPYRQATEEQKLVPNEEDAANLVGGREMENHPVYGKNLSNTLPSCCKQCGWDVATDDMNVQTIDPEGFAIYPATNGKAIAWIDSLNPAQAALKLTLDKGENITTVAEGVGRFFGIGDDFIVYTQQGTIMIYFWETRQFATLTREGEQGKLAELPVSGRTIIWYDATDPNRKQDNVRRSVVEPLP